ncbi:hypothetical protein GCM10017608_24210 [Agromyces luteolus]|uniref:Uncharacterized protein n=1 Tax=Agromyces luteolus TaxID=88373 RepID=A0A7C9LHE9_9MICO|nr:hypothetical protein [Agromyces luteolus]MUN07234.1 hypothetical protein [Agromyces luteolus]GLK28487.1 hypothetical protein GCM10017608_24210 [Agromyces luteolus]
MSTAIAPAPVAPTRVARAPLAPAPSVRTPHAPVPVASAPVASPSPSAEDAGSLAYASIAHGASRGYYRVLFESGPVDATAFATLVGVSRRESERWLAEQLRFGLLRPVNPTSGPTAEAYLPGEFVPILLDARDPAELDSARRMLAARADDLPQVLRTLWTGSEHPAEHLSRGIGRLWARMFAAAR